ncbi:MAG: L,D-transpeptidase family protein, partial [Sulfurimonas sp.]|nr:L,D-transpeptidase family protein [Sulfurimonas sp.]
MKTLFLVLISLSLCANEALTNYRISGIAEIEKQMDLRLTKKEYWSEYLKNIDTSFGYIESYSSLLTCDKRNSTLQLYKQDENSTFRFKKEYNAFTGKREGDKIEEGDLKTPVGIYRITKKIKKLDSFYGPLAFVTSYPNSYDKFRGKNGHGIWIHGLPTKQIRDEYTKGCIAINNSNIECLDKKINIEETLLIINEKEILKNTSKNILSSILSQLYLWR